MALAEVSPQFLSGPAVPIDGLTPEPHGLVQRHRRELITSPEMNLLADWDVAERGVNALRRTQRGQYGEFAARASHNEQLTQHSHEHGRRVESHLEALLINVPEVAQMHIPKYIIRAAAFFPYLHDADQLDTEQRNMDTADTHLRPKDGHALAGGLKVLSQAKEYAAAMNIPLTEAKKIVGAAAFMMIRHDEPAQLTEAMNGTQILPPDADGDTLLDAFESNQLDLASLRVNQLVKLTRTKKQRHGYIDAATPNGLHPLFEQEYAEELSELANDTSPLIPDYSDGDREGLHLLTQISVVADVFDYIMPPREAIIRRLGVDRSLKRPFFRPETSTEEFLNLVDGNTGNWEPHIGSDTARTLWEFLHPLEVPEDNVLVRSDYVNELLKETSIKGAFSFREIGARLMRGDLTPVDEVYGQRATKLQDKIEAKTGAPDASTHSRVRALDTDKDGLKAKLEKKFGATVYTENDITQFQGAVDLVLGRLQARYGVADGEMARYAQEGAEVLLMPYQTYDSGKTLEDFKGPTGGPRTIFELVA